MRNLMLVFLLLITIISCRQPHDQQLKRLNIQTFEKHQADGAWQYTDTNGNEVLIQKESGEYWESITRKGEYFTLRNNYYLNGRLKFTGQYFHDSGFNKGIWIDYDQAGRVIRTEDKDSPFRQYPWERVLVYLKMNRVDLLDKQTYIYNVSGAKGTYWGMIWKTGKTNSEGFNIIKNVRIEVSSGQATIEKETYCCKD
jgi:hypothetical protein